MFILGFLSMFAINEYDTVEQTETLEPKPKAAPQGVTTRTFVHAGYILQRAAQKHYINRMLTEIDLEN